MASVHYSVGATAYAVAITDADTEYEFDFPEGVKAVRIQARDTTDIRLAFVTGKVATPTDPYHTIKGGNPAFFDRLYFNKNKLYLAAGAGSKVVEILCFT